MSIYILVQDPAEYRAPSARLESAEDQESLPDLAFGLEMALV